jgi:hypothetical protein
MAAGVGGKPREHSNPPDTHRIGEGSIENSKEGRRRSTDDGLFAASAFGYDCTTTERGKGLLRLHEGKEGGGSQQDRGEGCVLDLMV